ncbi:hypothetical protein EV174_004670 [Coemansia sp. RSA 2320]|nr:hypothetical protein EV174_004670 [Coemansia sp. RSA 2320]
MEGTTVVRVQVNLSVNGIPIDFDYAIDPDTECIVRLERTGTLPFMSVLSLERHAGQRTELDDWESLLYVLCWQATFGINNGDRKTLENTRKLAGGPTLKILDWRNERTMKGIAASKRNHLCLAGAFNINITSRIWNRDQDTARADYLDLQMLAEDLYEAMFQNEGVNRILLGMASMATA